MHALTCQRQVRQMTFQGSKSSTAEVFVWWWVSWGSARDSHDAGSLVSPDFLLRLSLIKQPRPPTRLQSKYFGSSHCGRAFPKRRHGS
jgi:hypothetical protein